MFLLHVLRVVMHKYLSLVELVESLHHLLECLSYGGVVSKTEQRIRLSNRRSVAYAIFESFLVPINHI